jgi:hypothetical protein
MATKRLPRPRDPIQLGKLIVDIATGQVEDDQAKGDNRKKSASVENEPQTRSRYENETAPPHPDKDILFIHNTNYLPRHICFWVIIIFRFS